MASRSLSTFKVACRDPRTTDDAFFWFHNTDPFDIWVDPAPSSSNDFLCYSSSTNHGSNSSSSLASNLPNMIPDYVLNTFLRLNVSFLSCYDILGKWTNEPIHPERQNKGPLYATFGDDKGEQRRIGASNQSTWISPFDMITPLASQMILNGGNSDDSIEYKLNSFDTLTARIMKEECSRYLESRDRQRPSYGLTSLYAAESLVEPLLHALRLQMSCFNLIIMEGMERGAKRAAALCTNSSGEVESGTSRREPNPREVFDHGSRH